MEKSFLSTHHSSIHLPRLAPTYYMYTNHLHSSTYLVATPIILSTFSLTWVIYFTREVTEVKRDANSICVHPQPSYNGLPMDGVLMMAFVFHYLWGTLNLKPAFFFAREVGPWIHCPRQSPKLARISRHKNKPHEFAHGKKVLCFPFKNIVEQDLCLPLC
jgi:hypothetical protein